MGADTIIGAGVVAVGNIVSEGDIIVDGTLTGDIKAAGNVTLDMNAVVKGKVSGQNVMVAGALDGNIVAIGEAGLDYHYDNSPRADQERGFRTHIEAARATGLPLVIHAREADADIARILEEETEKGAFPFVLHCFTGSPELARRGLALGGYVSFSGVVTFKNAVALRDIASEVPLDRLLVETDAPYLAPEPVRGRSNEPAFVAHTASRLAALRELSEAEMARATTENFLRLFRKAPRLSLTAPASAT